MTARRAIAATWSLLERRSSLTSSLLAAATAVLPSGTARTNAGAEVVECFAEIFSSCTNDDACKGAGIRLLFRACAVTAAVCEPVL